VERGNGAPVATFALLKGCHGMGEKEGASSAQCHVKRGSGGGPWPTTTVVGGRHWPESARSGHHDRHAPWPFKTGDGELLTGGPGATVPQFETQLNPFK
jgi:hypothetical protein